MTEVRIYAVRQDGHKPRLVRSPNKPQAVRHVVSDTVHASVATQDEIAELCGDGVKVEDIKADDV